MILIGGHRPVLVLIDLARDLGKIVPYARRSAILGTCTFNLIAGGGGTDEKILGCFVLPALLSWLFGVVLRKMGWIKDGDLKIEC